MSNDSSCAVDLNITCPNANLCLDMIDVNADGHVFFFGILIQIFLLFYSFYAVAIIADAHLVVSLETHCVRWNIREDVAGASFMAFGSAAPEIIINAVSTLKALFASDEGDNEDTALGVGAIIGSGMIAFTVIPGACGLATKEPLELKRRPLARDVFAYSFALLLLYVALSAEVANTGHALAMVGLYVCYMLVVVCSPGVRQLYRVKYLGRAPRVKMSFVEQQQEAAQSQREPAAPGTPAAGSVAPLQAAGATSSTAPMPTVIATSVGASDAARLWDALPITSPMEFSPLVRRAAARSTRSMQRVPPSLSLSRARARTPLPRTLPRPLSRLSLVSPSHAERESVASRLHDRARVQSLPCGLLSDAALSTGEPGTSSRDAEAGIRHAKGLRLGMRTGWDSVAQIAAVALRRARPRGPSAGHVDIARGQRDPVARAAATPDARRSRRGSGQGGHRGRAASGGPPE
eukprot:4869090-Prymnesium_polylepis.1